MSDFLSIRSVSFDTSFLLKPGRLADKAITLLVHDQISCFVTATVASELEQLKVWGRISSDTYKLALNRWKHAHATLVDFKNRLLSNAFAKACVRSMETRHGIQSDDIINDCAILVSTLKKGADLFLSEDFHFTSKITRAVIQEVQNAACSEYHIMCGPTFYSIDTNTFLEAYHQGRVDLQVIESRTKSIRKNRKKL